MTCLIQMAAVMKGAAVMPGTVAMQGAAGQKVHTCRVVPAQLETEDTHRQQSAKAVLMAFVIPKASELLIAPGEQSVLVVLQTFLVQVMYAVQRDFGEQQKPEVKHAPEVQSSALLCLSLHCWSTLGSQRNLAWHRHQLACVGQKTDHWATETPISLSWHWEYVGQKNDHLVTGTQANCSEMMAMTLVKQFLVKNGQTVVWEVPTQIAFHQRHRQLWMLALRPSLSAFCDFLWAPARAQNEA